MRNVGRDVLVVQFRWLVGISPLTSEGCGLIPCEGSHPFRAADGAHGVGGEVGSWPVSDLEGIFKPPPGRSAMALMVEGPGHREKRGASNGRRMTNEV